MSIAAESDEGVALFFCKKTTKEPGKPVAYWSRGLTAAERKLSATAVEATAMHDVVLHWKIYLATSPFNIITDHGYQDGR